MQTSSLLRYYLLIVTLSVLLRERCYSFTSTTRHVRSPSGRSLKHPLIKQSLYWSSAQKMKSDLLFNIVARGDTRQRFMIEIPDNVSEDNEEKIGSQDKTKTNSDEPSGSIARTLLLAVPLFCKFIIVLLIKFLTDAVVYPILFLARLVRLTKNRFLKLIGKPNRKNSQGDSSST